MKDRSMVEKAPIAARSINGQNIAEWIAGKGSPLLLLHGWGANIELVRPLAEKLIPAGYRVYLLDLPGFGQSDPPPRTWTVQDYAAFVIAYLDAHNLEKVFLFGHSFGGRLGLILGAEHPGRLIKMALADSAGVKSPVPPLQRLRLGVYKSARKALEKIGAKSISERLRRWYGQRYGSADYQNVSGVMRETFVNVVNEDLLPYASRVQVSTLLFWGDHDEDTPLWQGRLLEKTIPDAGLIIHEGAGHYSYLDKLNETARVMDYFFRQ